MRTTPTPDAVRTLLAGLLGRQVTVSDLAASECAGALAGRYVTSADGEVAAGFVCDLGAAAYLGAALTLVPRTQAEECIANGQISDTLGENLTEVLNIASRLFNDAGWQHLRLVDVVDAVGAEPWRAVGTFSVEVEGYGAGAVQLVEVTPANQAVRSG
ncbi:MAG: hypothetical protein GX868_07120 [Actinobacteria bacterium]|nr:hypothetical protein [Actinomycetota bacterium]